MLDMTSKIEDKSSFITDIDHINDSIVVNYADGSVSQDEPYILHNYNVYRRRMEQQVYDYAEKHLDKLGIESFKLFLHRYIPIVGSLIGLYYLYNIDISVIMKILITILVLLGNGLNYIINEIWTIVLSYDFDQTEAYLEYVHNIDKYVIRKIDEDSYILPIEDIGKHNLSLNQVKEIGETISSYRQKFGEDIEEIKLTYHKNKTPSI